MVPNIYTFILKLSFGNICNHGNYHFAINFLSIVILQSTDVIFEAIIAEWAYKVFGNKYNLNRQQAVEAVKEMNLSETEIS